MVEQKPPLPNFLVLGTARSGTTSIHRYLRQHPEVCVSQWKETDFFAFRGQDVDFSGPGDPDSINKTAVTTIDGYRDQFAHWTGEPAVGESSPNYLYIPGTAERIGATVPDAKMIVTLRQPAERAYSDFVNMVKLGFETTGAFEEALASEDERIQAGWGPYYHYAAKGFYGEQLNRYLDQFDPDQLHVLRFTDLQENPANAMKEIYEFLGVDASFNPDTDVTHNASGVPVSRSMHELLTRSPVARWCRKRLVPARIERYIADLYGDVFLNKPPLEDDVKAALTRRFLDDIERLEARLDWDLDSWKEPAEMAERGRSSLGRT